jgi:hypothetical protein
MNIFCCGCFDSVKARLTDGREIYPHRKDLWSLPFWICDKCSNYVGCKHKTSVPTDPLGNIPTKELRDARQHIHKILDPIWKSGKISRNKLYRTVSDRLGYEYHTAEIRTIEEARRVYKTIARLAKDVVNGFD